MTLIQECAIYTTPGTRVSSYMSVVSEETDLTMWCCYCCLHLRYPFCTNGISYLCRQAQSLLNAHERITSISIVQPRVLYAICLNCPMPSPLCISFSPHCSNICPKCYLPPTQPATKSSNWKLPMVSNNS